MGLEDGTGDARQRETGNKSSTEKVRSKLVKNCYTVCRRIKVIEAYLSSIAQMYRESF